MKNPTLKNGIKKKSIGMIQLFCSFDKTDFNKFDKFINSPIFNTNKNLVLLFDLIKKNSEKNRLNELSFEEMFLYVFKAKTFEGTKIRKLAVKMTELIKLYFICHNKEQYKQVMDLLLLNELNKRNLTKQFAEHLLKYDCTRNKKNLGDLIFRMNDIVVAYNKYRFYNASMNFKKVNETIEHIDENLEMVYLSGKILNSILSLTNKKFAQNISNNLDEKAFVENNREKFIALKEKYPAYFLFFLLAELLLYNQEQKITELLKFFNNNLENIPYGSADLVINSLISYLIVEKGLYMQNEETYFTYEDLVSWGFDERLKIISPFVLIYITNLISQLTSKNLIENYLTDLAKKTDPSFRESLLNISKSIINLKNKMPNDAMKNLMMVKNKGTHIYLITKILSLQVNMELKDAKFINSEIDSLKHFINRRNDIPQNLKEKTIHFLHEINKVN